VIIAAARSMNYYSHTESGAHSDQWTWFSRAGQYRAFGIVQNAHVIRRFFYYSTSASALCKVYVVGFGPWAAYLYRELEGK
jgi:hypothetical protein